MFDSLKDTLAHVPESLRPQDRRTHDAPHAIERRVHDRRENQKERADYDQKLEQFNRKYISK
jgi:hypothetical protein